MKKTILTLLIASGLLSCKKDEESATPCNEGLNGTWGVMDGKWCNQYGCFPILPTEKDSVSFQFTDSKYINQYFNDSYNYSTDSRSVLKYSCDSIYYTSGNKDAYSLLPNGNLYLHRFHNNQSTKDSLILKRISK